MPRAFVSGLENARRIGDADRRLGLAETQISEIVYCFRRRSSLYDKSRRQRFRTTAGAPASDVALSGCESRWSERSAVSGWARTSACVTGDVRRVSPPPKYADPARAVPREPLGVIENAALPGDPRLQLPWQARIGGAQIDPEGLATLSRQFNRVERRAGRWLQHIGLVRVPFASSSRFHNLRPTTSRARVGWSCRVSSLVGSSVAGKVEEEISAAHYSSRAEQPRCRNRPGRAFNLRIGKASA
jgi:hypothetical protein